MANYLITGAAGFIASRTATMLMEQGHTVFGVDNLNNAYDVRMKEFRLEKLKKMDEFTFKELNISDKESVLGLSADIGDVDGIINLAARAGVRTSLDDPWVYVETNTTGTLNLLELSKRMKIPKFVLASTSSIYGLNAPLPTPETAQSSFPLQVYASSKKGAEALCHAYHHLYGIDVTIFRYFTVYGPVGRPDMSMFRFARWIIEGETLHLNGDGNQTRGFTYIDDIARGTILGLKNVGFEIMNLGGHEVISMNDLIAMIEDLAGKKAIIEHHEFHKADMMANQADVTKVGELLDWEPVVGLKEGVAKMVGWYNDNREWAKNLSINI